jgi:hypothetical protein
VEGCTLEEVLDDVADVPLDAMVDDLQSKAVRPLPRTASARASEAVRLGAEWSRLRNESEAAAAASELPPPLASPGVRDEAHPMKPQWRRGLPEGGGRALRLGVTLTPSDCQHRRMRPPRAWCDDLFGGSASKFTVVVAAVTAAADAAAAAADAAAASAAEADAAGAGAEADGQAGEEGARGGGRLYSLKVTSYGKTKGEYYWQGGDMVRLVKELGLQPGDMLVLERTPAAEAAAAAAQLSGPVVGASVVRCAVNPHAAVILAAAAAALAKRLSAAPAPNGGAPAWRDESAKPAFFDGDDDDDDDDDEEGGGGGGGGGGGRGRRGSGRAARARRNPYGDDFATEASLLWDADAEVHAADDYDEYMGSDEEGGVAGGGAGGGRQRSRGPRRPSSGGAPGAPRRRSMPSSRPLRAGQTVPAAALDALRPLSAAQLVTLLTNFYTGLRGGYKVPHFARTELDLHVVFWAAMERGGYETVTEGKQWRAICRCLGSDLTGLTSASHCMRLNYERCLLDFENYLACGQYEADAAAGAAPQHDRLTGAATRKFSLPQPEGAPPAPVTAAPAQPFASRRGSEGDDAPAPAPAPAAAAANPALARLRRAAAAARRKEADEQRAALAGAAAELAAARAARDAAAAPWTASAAAAAAVEAHRARVAALEAELAAERGREAGLAAGAERARAALEGAAPPDPALEGRVAEAEGRLRELEQGEAAAAAAAAAAEAPASPGDAATPGGEGAEGGSDGGDARQQPSVSFNEEQQGEGEEEEEEDEDEPISDVDEPAASAGAKRAADGEGGGGGKRARGEGAGDEES